MKSRKIKGKIRFNKRQVKEAEKELKKIKKLFSKKVKRITKPVRLEITRHELLSYYAKESQMTKSRMLDKILYFYEKNSGFDLEK